ncbi:F-box/FBD/LRR-repeat protein At4g00160-like, partial [Oryza brachyantha]|uniref:F-box/FBD/LRR-repeat protein At4g00160-like n=1 Tax=Oryza brachyantha TaxID=4533 RepID=UPI001ADA6A3A
GGDGGGDCISELPEDVLRLILLRLPSAAAAARTSVLSRGWRSLWSTLPELRFPGVTDLARVAAALRLHDAPVLLRLHVATGSSSPREISAVLAMAAPRLAGELLFDVSTTPGHRDWMDAAADQNSATAVAADGIGGASEIPSFPKATEITISLRDLCIRLPTSGVFQKLTALRLNDVRFESACDIGDVVSSERCPSLQELRLCRANGVSNLAIRSESLLRVDLSELGKLQELTIFAPVLRELGVSHCFNLITPAAEISAPALETLRWIDMCNRSTVRFGAVSRLQRLSAIGMVYGQASVHDWHSLQLLKSFRAVPDVQLVLNYPYSMLECNFLMDAVNMPPAVKILSLRLSTRGHNFGPCVFQLLRMSTGIKELNLELTEHLQAQVPCSSGCICHKPQDWETKDILLCFLQKVEIRMLSGAQSEICFVKQLLRWAPALKMITVSFGPSVNVSEEACHEILSCTKPDICMEIYLYCNRAKVMHRAVNRKRPRDD